jgi:hypothetical protein
MNVVGDVQERRPRLDGPHCAQPTRFGPGFHTTPPTSPAFARMATAHGTLVSSQHWCFLGVLVYRSGSEKLTKMLVICVESPILP